MATALIYDATGVPINQQDWHALRRHTAMSLGEKLRRDVVPSDDARSVVDDFYDWAANQSSRALSTTKAQWIQAFLCHRATSGNMHLLTYITNYGLPPEILARARRNRDK